MSFDTEAESNANKSIVVVQMQPKERLISGWTNSSGTIYYIDTTFYVIDVAEDGVSLVEAGSASVGSDEWFFDDAAKRLYVDVGEDPENTFLHVCYRLFYASRAINLPYDMASGTEVPYTGIVRSTSSFKDEIDSDDLVGISLAGNGSVKFFNDGSWASIYNKLFWETTLVKIYVGFESIVASDYNLLYRGYIDSKSYTTTSVTFKLKDFVEKLRAEVPLDLFTSSDGDITEEGKPKRRIYGRAKVLGTSLDKIKDGYALTGTFTKATATTITGSGSDLLDEASPEDTIILTNDDGDEVEYSIESVDSDTQITLSEEIDDFPAASTINITHDLEATPHRNRTFEVCDHQMREPTTTVDNGISARYFTVDDSSDFEAGDIITVDGVTRTINSVSTNDTIELVTDLPTTPSNGDAVVKQAVHNVWFDNQKLVYPRDFSITNGDPSKVVIGVDAEFNLTKQQPVSDGSSTALTFVNASREVTGNIAFLDFFKPRDWINSGDILHTTWYEVLSVEEDKLYLRTAYAGTNRTNDGFRKSIKLITDDSRILIDANGITENASKTGVWVKTASQVVKHLLDEQSLSVNASAFSTAATDAPFLPSLALPLAGSNSRPKVRDIIDLMNKSVLGSLHENADREVVYNVLSPKKPAISEVFRDDDIINYSIQATGKNISKKITARYRHEDADIFSGEEDADVVEYTNSVIDYISDIEREEQLDLYLWNTTEATLVSERVALLRETINTIVKLRSNTLFLNKALNEKVYLELRDMFQRFGTDADANFIGVVTMLKKAGNKTDMEISDLGGWYNKICIYAAASQNDFANSTTIDRAQHGFYTTSSGIIDDSSQYRMNLYI